MSDQEKDQNEANEGFHTQDSQANLPASLNLKDLPVELFLYISSYLDASTLVHGLSLTCKQFHRILNDDSMWKSRISQVWPNVNYPPLPRMDDDELFWKLSCVAIERHAKLWKNSDSLEKILLNNAHYSTIDGVLLMRKGSLCISGGRDRSLVLWQIPGIDEETDGPVNRHIYNNAHNGWIWDLTAIDDTVYSCSWDSTVKAWQACDTGLQHLTSYEGFVTGALLCVTSCRELYLFATGSYCKSVFVFDSRTGQNPIIRYEPHQRAVVSLAMNSNYIISASEDKTVNVWDQKAGKTLKTIEISKNSFPMSMCLKKDVAYVGDSNANLHLLDPRKDFEPVKIYSTAHEKAITGVYANSGCLITSSKDKTVRISSPTDPPQQMVTFEYNNGEIACIDYLDEVLAVSGTDEIEIWRPKITAS